MDALLSDIDAFLRCVGMSERAFGEQALNDVHLVRQLREGRELRSKTEERVRQFMEERLSAGSDARASGKGGDVAAQAAA